MSTLVVVAACIQNSNNEFLIAQKPKNSSSFPLCWEFPGGKVEPLELESEALIREIQEELGVEIQVVQQIGESKGQALGCQIQLKGFLCKLAVPAENIQLFEHQQIQWVSPAKFFRYKMGPLDQQLIESSCYFSEMRSG